MATVEGTNAILANLNELIERYNEEFSVVVGYTAEYAIFVHEDLTANHPNGGQAKYLEEPARERHDELMGIVVTGLKRGLSLEQAILMAGLALQGWSQKLVPVDTGNLRASAFTEIRAAEGL